MSTNTPSIPTAVLGFPRIGRQRELKFALESFWKGTTSEADLLAVAHSLRERHWLQQRAAGITFIPSNDFSLYDQVLDALVLVGATPTRFGSGEVTLQRYFAMARNSSEQTAMEMTKWFDTNYHYLVPEWSADLTFAVDTRKLLAEFQQAKALGIVTRPVLIGPVTLLKLGKSIDGSDSLALLPKLVAAYSAILAELANAGAEWVQIDEPSLVTDLPEAYVEAYRTAYAELTKSPIKLMLTTYFGALDENLALATSLGAAGLHIDAVRAPGQVEAVAASLQPGQILSLGCVDGRNIWLSNLEALDKLIYRLTGRLESGRLQLATSCSLLHSPYDTADETKLDPRIQSWLAFSQQKLEELAALSAGTQAAPEAFAQSARRIADRASAESSFDPTVRASVASLEEQHFQRLSSYPERAKVQRNELKLPLLPTTTIGSFPQTAEVRQKRAAHRKGHLDDAAYEQFLREQTEDCIRRQERLGLDVLVHGEFERNDMVEYFGEHLKGFAFTQNGWVQSYGSRCVKPPVIYGDVSRPEAITVGWSSYAQSLTTRHMKGMLTGPITILQWSFVRNDIPERDTAFQIARALRDEVCDLEQAGIRIIQVDEPALREGLPLRNADWEAYLTWATEAFRLATSGVTDATQIHTHMCYCEFEDVLPAIAALDADVISMESARSRMEMLEAFGREGYPNEIGPGVYDIHSPRVPSAEEMQQLLKLALEVLRIDQVWVNPDCGLKTRGWPEVERALTNLCEAARATRAALNL
ncbi:5-methyltetrahydropteroyltriglutamate--homocysteine S-methyltransferase [Granulicella sp. WH15]|uniref:5-methyltetrahydropteroyltriglutamate-- homocysteine S-methyltransferase n=1 Tax=Granulicella sp. WH15 TaxID=2602070 RepID=UPI001366DBC7|nr:5-methyltetrahydropteroyltriglutamate--homocysteine S-methyltransferase [Granulicella sp. WH15]QHN02552.1 5-methyltetrahydropteroyltriglutamate--homocysteine S-methyltransferase [Granulicella sp. WH15]